MYFIIDARGQDPNVIWSFFSNNIPLATQWASMTNTETEISIKGVVAMEAILELWE